MPGPDIAELSTTALSAAADCEHVDVRLVRTRTALHSRRDDEAQAEVDHDSVALGVRVIRNGCWGFAATDVLTPDSVAGTARRAMGLAAVARPTVTQPVRLTPEPVHRGHWRSTYEVDPFDLSPRERADFLAWGCDLLLAHDAVDHAEAHVMAVREQTDYVDSAGTAVSQTRVRTHAEFSGISVRAGSFDTLRTIAPPVGRGWEFLTGPASYDWATELSELPGHLAAKVTAPSVDPGRHTLVIHPTNLWLTIHESVAHATEFDRIKGYEANYAGTSFVRPHDIGTLRYGSPLMNVRADRTAPHGLSTVAWDDEGVAAQEWPLIADGVLVDVQLDRAMAAELGSTRSNGCAYADSGSHVPVQRMPNVNLLPDPAGGSLDDLIGGVDDGILVVGDGSWSIDMQRYNFQFTGQRFERIRAGRLAGPVRDVAYQGSTPQFWNSMVAVGGPDTYHLGGAFNCGKGQPGQVAPVSHGCPPAVFEGVNVLNSTKEGAA